MTATEKMGTKASFQRIALTAALGMMLVLLVALAGCGGGQQQEDYSKNFVGEWELTDMTEASASSSDSGVDLSLLKAFGYSITLTLDEDKTLTMEMAGETMEGTWEVKDASTISVDLDGSEGEASLQGDKLVMEEDGDSLTFERMAEDASTSSSAS